MKASYKGNALYFPKRFSVEKKIEKNKIDR